MTPEQEAKAESIIERQITMSGHTLDTLRRAGLTDEKQVQLDFFFIAPSEKDGKSLVANLLNNDCLELSIKKHGGFLSRKYVVSGKTHPTAVSTQVLADWLPWIVVQGVINNCVFDGWGAEV